jgi:hypothetical protein
MPWRSRPRHRANRSKLKRSYVPASNPFHPADQLGQFGRKKLEQDCFKAGNAWPLEHFPMPWDRKTSLDLYFIAFSSREPGSTSLENALAQIHVARTHAERQGCSFAMPVRCCGCVVPMAISRPAMSGPMMSRPTVAAGVAANMAMAQLLFGRSRRDLCIGAITGCARVLAIAIPSLLRGTMATGHRSEDGQALIIGVRGLNFFALVDAARSGTRIGGSCDQGGGENTVQE